MKTAIFIVIAIAALGAAGVTTIMISTVPVHAADRRESCHSNTGSVGCSPIGPTVGFECKPDFISCHETGRGHS
jgi:hypothetical protein